MKFFKTIAVAKNWDFGM